MTNNALHPSRRQLLAGLVTLPLAGCSGSGGSPGPISTPAPAPPSSVVPSPSLNALAQRSGRRFGSAVAAFPGPRVGGTVQNPAYAAIVAAECGVVVAENEMKWATVQPRPFEFDFTRMDQIVEWARANEQAVRGHTLLWHRPRWFPEWLNNYDFGANPASEAERVLSTHIRTVTDRYRGIIASYDVVNEAIDHDTNGLMETSLSRAMGSPEAVLDHAFRLARELLPDAELVYNDYMSWEPHHAHHVADVLRLLEGFRERNVPVDTLGIQSHIEMFSIDPATGVGPYAERELRAFLDEVVSMGYKLMITEFDVKDKALPSALPARDAAVADYTGRYLDLMLGYEQLEDVLAWGMVDGFSWLQGFAPRDDGLEVRGLPYSSDYRPKPLRAAIANSFIAAA